jgi:hypothetical protein
MDPAQWHDALTAATITTPLILDTYPDPDFDFDFELLERAPNPNNPLALGRARTHQATGMMQVQLGLNSSTALARLRGYAFAHQRLLSDVAHDVVERTLVFTHDMD